MNRRPDWHPSYGTPMPPKYADRVAGVRDRLGIKTPEPNYRFRGWLTVIALCGSLACMSWSMPAAFGCVGLALWAGWPTFRNPDRLR